MLELLIRYLHFLGILTLAATLVAEHMLIARRMEAPALRRLAVIDGIYGASAVLVLLTGLASWLWVGKPASYYTPNGVFHAKLAAFVVMVLLSIRPTFFFLQHRRTTGAVEVPASIVMQIRLALVVLVIIPLLAVLMARGIGLG